MILVVMLLDDVGSRGKGKFLLMGKYSRIQHHFLKGHSERCTDMFGGGGVRASNLWMYFNIYHGSWRALVLNTSSDRTKSISVFETLKS